jgi:sulfide:quinone oxidoreductase
MYNTTLPVIFGVKKYAARLMKIVQDRGIQLNTRLHLVEIDAKTQTAVFENLDKPAEFKTFNVKFIS